MVETIQVSTMLTIQQYETIKHSVENGKYISISDYMRNAVQREIERQNTKKEW